jgi:hypothetical protein
MTRGHLARVEAKRRRKAKIEWEYKIFQAATSIQRRVRGMEARTRMEVERCIYVIMVCSTRFAYDHHMVVVSICDSHDGSASHRWN